MSGLEVLASGFFVAYVTLYVYTYNVTVNIYYNIGMK